MSLENKKPLNRKIVKIVFLILAALLLSGIMEYFTNNTIYRYVTGNHQQTIQIDDLASNGYDTVDGVTVSTKADANFVGKVNKYVYCITVKFSEKAKTNLPIQIYYTTGREEFSEDQSMLLQLSEGEDQESLIVQNKIKQIRIDIGNSEGDTFNLDKIIVNDKELRASEHLSVRTAEWQNLGVRMAVYFVFFAFLLLHVLMGPKRLYDVVYRYRYAIGGGIVVFATIFELSGSSIGAMADKLGTENYTVWGTIRQIRTDEWALNTQMALSQCATGFHYFADAFRGTATDMFMVYGQPVWTFAEIFRPFHWGYLLLGASRGLAFFWTARLVCLLLVSFDFGMLVTKQKKGLSFAYALLITLSPLVQWWVDVNGLVEMLMFAQLALILFDKYLRADRSKVRLGLAAGIAWCAGGFILTLYPSWQVPVAYIILGCIVWLIWENWGSIKITRKDVAGIAGVLVVFAGLMLSVLLKSGDTIKLVMGSEYPGQRVLLGGTLHMLKSCLFYPATIFYPYTQDNLPMNVCEMAKMFDFFPLGNILAIYVLVSSKKKDKFLCCVGTVDLILGLWCSCQWPELLAKLSLLSMSQAGRAVLAFEICNVILLVRSISILADRKSASRMASILLSMILALILAVSTILVTQTEMPLYMTKERLIIAGIVLFMVTFLLLQYGRFKALATISVVVLMVCAGLTVNPVQRGLNMVYQSGVYQEIQSLEASESGKWLVEDDIFLSNLPTIAGASTVNATSTYPNLTYWKQFDESGKFKEIYNRYAWISAKIVEGDTTFKLIGADQFQVLMGTADVQKAGIKYVLTTSDLSGLGNGEFEQLYSDPKYKIYKVKN